MLFRNYNAKISQHLSNEESEALKSLSANWNLIIQKANKGQSVILVEMFTLGIFKRFLMTLQSLKKFKSRKKFWNLQLKMKDV